MHVVDFYCGAGGLSAGAMEAGCTVTHGIDMDSTAIRHWAANTGGHAVCVEICEASMKRLPWPAPTQDVHVHASPPCTMLSKARAWSTTEEERMGGLEELAWCTAQVVKKGYKSFSIENVCTPLTQSIAERGKQMHPNQVDWIKVNASEYGTPSDRLRLIITTPGIVQHLKEMPVVRVSVRKAFETAGLDLPAAYIKNNTRSRDGSPCVRSIEECSQTVVASHPLTWCTREGTTVRCLTVQESAVLMGFPVHWQLPKGQREGMRAVGNAIPPPLSMAIMKAAAAAATLSDV